MYELPLFAAPRLVDVIVSTGAVVLTVMDSCADAVCAGDPLSVTVTVKLDVPVFVAVPEIAPELESDRPAGSFPELTDHVYPGVPPLALSVALYELPVCAAPRLVDVTVSVAGVALTVIDSCTEAVCAGDPLSCTATVNVDVPLAVGDPEITPPLESVRPAGSFPEASDHV